MKYKQRMMRNNIIMFLFLIVINPLSSQQINYPSDIIHPVSYGTSLPLMEIINNAPPEQRNNEPSGEALSHEITETVVPQEPLLNYDPVLQNQYGQNRSIASLAANFDGVNNLGNVLPPDPNGDVGPNHYFQTVNSHFAIYDKSGTLLMGPYSIDSLWAGFTGEWTTMSKSDPIVLYDHLADRWFVSIVAYNLDTWDFYELIAISQGPDPLGAYYRYAYHFNDYAPDYPKFGVWPDGYYMSANKYTYPFTFTGMAAYVFERDSMLVGNEARLISFTSFTDNTAGKGLLPSDLDGQSPPQNSPNFFTYIVDGETQGGSDRLGVFELHVDWLDTNNSTFTGPSILTPEPFNRMCTGGRNCVPQLDSQEGLDLMGDRLMYRLQYRNFGSYQTMVVCHSVDAGNSRAGIRWYELRNTGTEWNIYQQGTYAPSDSLYRWMGSIAMDKYGNIALGYSASSEFSYPSLRIAGRSLNDTLGQMTMDEKILIAGTGSQLHRSNRWGDYSMMSVDPVDGETFWFTGEYYQTTSWADWHTRIAAISLFSTVVANRHIGDPTSNLGGTLSLDNLNNDNLDFTNVESDSDPVPVAINDQYSVRTNNYTLQDERHLLWNDQSEDHLLKKLNFEMSEEIVDLGLNANFDFQDGVTISSNQQIPLQLHDPWYLENPSEPDPHLWVQPDEFRPLSEQGDGQGNVQVFLNQGGTPPNLEPPYYTLRAPHLGGVISNNIYAFKAWRAYHSDGTTYDNDGSWAELIDSTNYLNCPVVFKQAGATVKAVYEAVNNRQNYTLVVLNGEELTIPNGADIEFADGFQMQIEGKMTSETGPNQTVLHPVTEYGAYFDVNETGALEMNQTTFKDLPMAINRESWITNMESNQIAFNKCLLINTIIAQSGLNGTLEVLPVDLLHFENCTFDNVFLQSNLDGSMDYWQSSKWNIRIVNTIFLDSQLELPSASNITINEDYNLFYNSEITIPYYSYGAHSLVDVDPILSNPANGNYTLKQDSPCIDAGDPDTPLDPDSTIADMGAFYYDAVPAIPSGFNVTVNGQHHPVLSWNGNTEPDLDGYNVYRRLGSGMYALWNTVDENTTTITDLEVSVSGNPFDPKVCYHVKALDWIGQESLSTPSKCKNYRGIGKELMASLPEEYALHNSYPNPFNPVTTIPFDLPEPSLVTLTIYDLMGREVRTLVQGEVPAGFQLARWNGKDSQGNPLPSGMYLVQLLARSQTGNKVYTRTRKLVLLK